ncbi:A-kinase-interacting protein 1 [Empidonax traillii]|uniref:A-kinase-interacting protein 1 n=1 Tax=Empidonax traillii TaxID=164674 RepID=UPI000FFD7A5B|nr:A-kinase-interacting protein 1 [Empidonax traillii]
MEVARAGRTAGLARDVLERARRRAGTPGPGPGPEEESERLSAAFDSIVKLMGKVSRECEKYYSFVGAPRCKEHEIKHICKYHGRQAEERDVEEERTEASRAPSRAQTCQQRTRQASKDLYIEVSPGIYSVTAISDDMAQQTLVVDVNAGQSVDVTFVL